MLCTRSTGFIYAVTWWKVISYIMKSFFRQKIYNANILDVIKNNLQERTPLDLIRSTLALFRALVLDDDVRVEFGKAHEHARLIASEVLCSIMFLMSSKCRDSS